MHARRILEVLLAHEVRFVVIGGVAAVVHGSPFATEDIDITPESSATNLSRLSDALRSLEARVRTQGVEDGLPFEHDAESLGAVGVWNLTTPAGELDISFVPNGTTGFDDLVNDSAQLTAFGLVIPVASLADVIRSKQAANRPQDQRVLPVLREILASRYHR
ncbi:MAG: hypothetical protein ACR2K3_11785 [Nocardioides sp.]